MCGILGYSLKRDTDVPRSDVDAALDTLGRRGPDGRGIYEKGPLLLGHTRLSIIDLSTGDQPMTNEDGSLVITFNGEVYNYIELRQGLLQNDHVFKTSSDTEVILHLYEEYGTECLDHLRGMFAFALWDEKQKVLFIARDRIGVKPLVYAEEEEGVFFASEIQALFALRRDLSRECDFSAIDHFLTLQYIPSPMTGFKAVRKLEPAHYMIVKEGKVQCIRRYWDIHYAESDIPFPEACERLREAVIDATKIRLRSDVPFGAFLSGGVDSSIVVAAMSRILNKPVKTFSVGFGVKGYDELSRAREIAELYKTEHTEFQVKGDAMEVLPELVSALGEPLGDSSIVPTYYIAKSTSRHVKVALTGDGGDETFAGYKRFSQLSFLDTVERYHLQSCWRTLRRITVKAERIFNKRRRRLKFPHTRADKALFLKGVERYLSFIALFSGAEKRHLYTPLMETAMGHPEGYVQKKFAQAEGLNRYLYTEQTTFLPEDILFKVDICSMRNSLECRSPLLDHKLIEFASVLPDEYKLHRGTGKFIFKEAFKDWFAPDFFERPKVGFAAPTHVWMKGELTKWCEDEILSNKTLSKVLRQEAVRELFNDVGEHHKRLWNLLILSLWFNRFGIEL